LGDGILWAVIHKITLVAKNNMPIVSTIKAVL
jgi:hypothetical protein